MRIFTKFIDFDKNKKVFYNNLYIPEYKLVLKMPLAKEEGVPKGEVKFKKFDLTKSTYLLSYI